VAAFEEGIAGEVFIPAVVVDQRKGTLLADKGVIVNLIVFGIEQMDFVGEAMKADDLFLHADEGISFLGIACNGDAADGKLDAQLMFNRSSDDGVIPEDLFGLIGIGRHRANADAGVPVVRMRGTTEADRIGRFADEGRKRYGMHVGLAKAQDGAEFAERFFKSPDGVPCFCRAQLILQPLCSNGSRNLRE